MTRWQPSRPIFRFKKQRIMCDDIGAIIVTAPNTGFFFVVPQALNSAHVLRLPTTTFTAWRWFTSWPICVRIATLFNQTKP